MDRSWVSTSIMLSLSLSLPLPLPPILTPHFLILILARCRTAQPLRLLILEPAAWACEFSFYFQFSAHQKVPRSVFFFSTLNTSPPPFRVCIAAGISEVFRILSGVHSVANGSYLSALEVPGLPRGNFQSLACSFPFLPSSPGIQEPSPEAHTDYAWV